MMWMFICRFPTINPDRYLWPSFWTSLNAAALKCCFGATAEYEAELERLVESRTEDLRKAQADLVLSEKFSTLGKVAGGIAHEIRNPLNAVKTSAYYLLNAKNATPEKVREHLERIDRQVSMVDSVVTALADVAKLPDADLKPLHPGTAPSPRGGSRQIYQTSIQVEYEFPAELPQVLADEHQIAIAFRNLVRNARDAMPDWRHDDDWGGSGIGYGGIFRDRFRGRHFRTIDRQNS